MTTEKKNYCGAETWCTAKNPEEESMCAFYEGDEELYGSGPFCMHMIETGLHHALRVCESKPANKAARESIRNEIINDAEHIASVIGLRRRMKQNDET